MQYFDGSTWVNVEGIVGLEGPQIYSGALPAEVTSAASGIRFVYDSATGFPPGTTVSPNLSFTLRAPITDPEGVIENCASADVSNGEVAGSAAQVSPECPTIELYPVTGDGDLVEKDWDIPAVPERSQGEAEARLLWSTGGRSGLDQVVVTDTAAPSQPLTQSVFNAFDLVRIDAITAQQDPLLTYDRVASVELLRGGDWVSASASLCPHNCDGRFPGVTLTAQERDDTTGFRLVFEESPTRADRLGSDPLAPLPGTGVARAFENSRVIHPVFALRDDLRSDADVPVLIANTFNNSTASEVLNTVRADGLVDGDVVATSSDGDVIVITPVDVQVDVVKTWDGGPLGVPDASVPASAYPSSRVTLTAHNQTPAKVDEITVTEPGSGTNPFDTFDLVGFSEITRNALGVTGTSVTLQRGSGVETVTGTEALELTPAQLADVTGVSVTFSGRIATQAKPKVVLDLRLRPAHRVTGHAPAPGFTVSNVVGVELRDLVNYPDVEAREVTDADDASISLLAQGIGLVAGKSFSPTEQTERPGQSEPSADPVTVTLTGTPVGPSRAVELVLEDSDPRFWNAYEFVGLSPLTLVAPIDQVRLDVLTGGTWSLVDGAPVLTGATWVDGVAGASASLPDAVTPEQVQGVRYVLTRADRANFENPATPTQPVSFDVQRRVDLRTGGPVPSTLAGSLPAPGESVVWDGTVALGGEEPWNLTINNLAMGATCTVTETQSGSATEVSYLVGDEESAEPPVVTIVHDDDENDGAAVIVRNTFHVGGIQIAKELTGSGTSLCGDLTFQVACTFDGRPLDVRVVSMTADGTTSLRSEVLTGLPVGAVCEITETNNGGADTTPEPVTVTVPNLDEDGEPQVVIAGFVNLISAGTVTLTKVIDGSAPERAAGETFTIQITCTVASGSGDRLTVLDLPLQITGGHTVQVAPAGTPALLPLGAHCWATETDDGGADDSKVSHGSFERALEVTADEQVLELTVTNTFNIVPGTGIPATGANVVGLSALAAALLAGGAVLLTRRRQLH